MGTGEAATGEPIKIGGIATNVPGIDFTWITGMAGAYFDCVNDNGGINGRPIEYIVEEEQIDPQQIAASGHQAHRDRRRARPRRQHEHHRLQRQPGVLRRAGLLPDHRRRRPGLLHQPELLGRQHGPVLLEPRRGAGRRPGRRREQDRHRLAQPARLRPHQQRRRRVRRERRAWRARASSRTCRSATRPGSPSSSCRRPATAAGWCSTSPGPAVLPLLQAIEQQGLVDSVIWASSTPPNDPSMAAGAEPGMEREVPHQRRVQRARLGPARPEPHERDPRAVRLRHPELQLRPDGLPGRAHRHRRPDEHRGRHHGRERERGLPRRQELHERHVLQALVLRQHGRPERVEQHRLHGGPEGRRTWC